MRFNVLGPLAVTGEAGDPIPIGGAKRRLLVILLLRANRVSRWDEIADLLWEGAPPAGGAHTIQSHISQLRKLLGPERLESTGGGYRLVVEPGELDSELFEGQVSEASELVDSDPAGAGTRLSAALGLWRGPALADAKGQAWAEAERVRLEDRRLVAEELLLEVQLATGDARAVATDAEEAISVEPLREQRWSLLIRALYRAGRRTEALDAYQRLRTMLADRLGTEPSPELRELERAILARDHRLGPSGWPEHRNQGRPATAARLPSGIVTFLLTDVVGSTKLWDSKPALMAEALVRHDNLMAAAVERHSGHLLKSRGEGDSTFSVFERASDAVAAAVDAQSSLSQADWPGGLALTVRMAVHTGEAIERDGDYYGGTVNRAARLRGIAQGGQILTTQVTAGLVAEHLTDGVSVVRLGDHRLRDLSRPETVYAVAGASATEYGGEPDGAETWDVPLPAPMARRARDVFVGRSSELEVLRSALKRSRSGETQVVLVRGEAGVGKSTLAARFVSEAFEDGCIVTSGRCVEDVGVPYESFASVVDQLVGSMPAPALTSWLSTYGGPVSRAFPSVQRSVAPLGSDAVEADVERHLLYRAVSDLLHQAAEDRPLVVVLEDLHWIDRSSSLLLRYLLDADSVSLLLIGTHRDSEASVDASTSAFLADLRRRDIVSSVSLAGLGDTDTLAMVEQFAGHGLREEEVPFVHNLWRETGGNPFFMREILLHLLETGAVEIAGDGRWRLLRDGSSLLLPESVLSLVNSRVARLGADSVDVLRAAAVIGRSFDVSLLVAVCERTDDEIFDVLDRADDAGLVSSAGAGRFRFAHSLVQQAIYQAQSATRQARQHRKVAQALEQMDSTSGRNVRELAHHWSMAIVPADVDKAVTYAVRAGELALEELAPHDAIHWFTHGLDLYGARDDALRCRLLVGLGEAQQQAGTPDHRETLLDAARLAQRVGADELLVRSALVNNRGGPSSRTEVDTERVEVLNRALAKVPGDDLSSRARLLATKAVELVSVHEPEERFSLSQEALAAARQAGDPATTLLVQHLRFDCIWNPATLSERVGVAQEMVDLAERLGDSLSQFRAALRQAAVSIEQADGARFREAVGWIDRMAKVTGWPYMQWSAAMSRSCEALVDGRFEDAEEHANRSLQIGSDSGQPEAYGVYGILLAETRRHQGRLTELLPVLEDAYRTLPLAALSMLIAVGYLEDDRVQDAREAIAPYTDDLFESVTFDEIWCSTLALASELAVRTEDPALATRLYERQLPYRDQVTFTRATTFGSVERHLGSLSAILGRPDYEEHFERSAAAHLALGSPLFQAYDHLDRGLALRRRGDPAAASWLERAAAAGERLGAQEIVRRATQD